MPPEDFVRICVQADLYWLAGAHAVELRLLKVGQYPHLGGHKEEQRLAGLKERAELDRLPRDPSVFGRIDFRVGEIEFGLSHSGLGLLDLSGRRFQLRLLNCDLLRSRLGLAQFSNGLANLRFCPGDLGECLLVLICRRSLCARASPACASAAATRLRAAS